MLYAIKSSGSSFRVIRSGGIRFVSPALSYTQAIRLARKMTREARPILARPRPIMHEPILSPVIAPIIVMPSIHCFSEEYRLAKYRLMVAKLNRKEFPSLGGIPGSAAARWQDTHRSRLDHDVRRCQRKVNKLRKQLNLPTLKPFKAKPADAADHRIARQYKPDATPMMF